MTEASDSTKKHRVVDNSESEDEGDDLVLSYQVKHMRRRLQEKNEQMDGLRKAIRKLEGDKTAYDHILNVVTSSWDTLQTDLKALLSRFGDAPASSTDATTTSNDMDVEVNDPEKGVPKNPLLRVLCGASLANTEAEADSASGKEEEEEISLELPSMEATIQARSSASKTLLTTLVNVLESQDKTLQRIVSTIEEKAPDAETNSALKDLLSKHTAAQQAANESTAQHHTLKEKYNTLRGFYLSVCETLAKTQSDLMGAEMELTILRRKVDRLSANQKDVVAAGPSGANAVASSGASGVKTEESKDGSVTPPVVASGDVADLTHRVKTLEEENEGLRHVADKRQDTEDQLREEILALKREVNEASTRPIADEEIMRHPFCIAQAHKCQVFLTEITDLRQRMEAMNHELMDLRNAQQRSVESAMAVEGESSQAYRMELDRITQMLAAASAERDKLQLKVEKMPKEDDVDYKASLIAEMQTMNEKQTEELKKLRTELTFVKGTEKTEEESSLESMRVLLRKMKKKESDWLQKKQNMATIIETYKNANKDSRDISAIRISENKLKLENSNLRKETEKLRALGETADEMVASKHAELKKMADDAELEVESQKEVAEALSSELNEIAGSFEEVQEQSSKLMQQLADRERESARLASERIKIMNMQNAYRSEREKLSAKVAQGQETIEAQAQAIDELKVSNSILVEQVNKLNEQVQLKDVEAQKLKELANTKVSMALDYKAQMQEARSKIDEHLNRMDDEAKRGDMQDRKIKRLEEREAALSRKLKRVNQGAPPSTVEKELRQLKERLRCPVCSDRMKSTIITKCLHMFCRECIDDNLRARNRKCPACGDRFGENDVKSAYIT